MLRVLVVDDQAKVRAGLVELLLQKSQVSEVGEAGTGTEALAQVAERLWDAVVLDIALPDMSGLNVLRVVRRQRPKLPVLMLSLYNSPLHVLSSFQASATGYLSKESIPEQCAIALQAVLAGNRYLDPRLAHVVNPNWLPGR